MSSPIVVAAVAGASAISGGIVVAGRTMQSTGRRPRTFASAGLRQALVSLLSALNQIEYELRSEPQSKTTVRVINEQMAKFPQIDYVIGRIHRRLFQPHLDALLARLSDAVAATMLAAPQELLPPLEAVSD